ncbi:AAEL002790-PA [Aedes aegypti]|uniref:AAEL002790-PA n=2 Tax=Aedes aegypti TaxID=7159 RepID=A0A1S4F329_AEDAE|nr:uncharacterized protein LOC5576123 [Aedes aegypti]EAT45979.1 AAEL002790-PA [Aedes aegypti]
MINACCVHDFPGNVLEKLEDTEGGCSASSSSTSFIMHPFRIVPDCNLPKTTLEKLPKDENNCSVAAPRITEDRFNPPVLVIDDLGKVCRLCLETDEQNTHEPLFAKEDIADFIGQSIGIEIQPNDGYPQMICQTCIERVTYIHRSREWFHKNDQFLKALVGELSNDSELPETVPTEETNLGEVAELFDSGFLEAEEVTLNELGMTPEENNNAPEDEPLARRKRSRRVGVKSRKKPRRPPDARSEMIRHCAELERIDGKLWCPCGASYEELKMLCRHIWEDHDMGGHVKPKRPTAWVPTPNVPANPLLLEEMAAVFNMDCAKTRRLPGK